ncbi:LOW QUALITY PROTEIN: hypothetical protein JCM24511_05090 [Saitozyma sp. JCM 24511]|nr:LOW QUALITY PROTEIN: hypothetical protein JCM24511_05090 [Saitozyma sp. JCM 24511]
MMTRSLALLWAAFLPFALGVTLTVDNQCTGTVYPAFAGAAATATSGGSQPFGWAQPPGATAFVVPDTWTNARLWARTGCASDGSGCKVGACNTDSIECSGSDWGELGKTLAEFNLGASGVDYYDVSMVEGFNLPMSIQPSTSSCGTGSCGTETDLLTQCDPALVYPVGSSQIWSCANVCVNGAELESDFDPSNSVLCCTSDGGALDRTLCTKDKIPFYDVMKPMCADGYIYADDDNYADATFGCASGGSYTITLCPGGLGSGIDPPSSADAVAQPTWGSSSSDAVETSAASAAGSTAATGMVSAAATSPAATSAAGIVSGAASASATGAGSGAASTTGAVAAESTAPVASAVSSSSGAAVAPASSAGSAVVSAQSGAATGSTWGGSKWKSYHRELDEYRERERELDGELRELEEEEGAERSSWLMGQ